MWGPMMTESSFIKALPDHLNAEIVSGTVTNIQEAVQWLSYTYLYIRMLRNSLAYGINTRQRMEDPLLLDLCVASGAVVLLPLLLFGVD